MSTDTYPIVGIQDGIGSDGSRPLRYEITKFANPQYNPYAKDQLNLFLLALEKVQAMPRTERLSWFQIGGIHGEPYADWDNSKGLIGGSQPWLGYCTHASILFPTWHRLYIALIEQAVHECMKQVLSEFPLDRQAALKPAVDHWRYPYWDWAYRQPDTQRIKVPELMRLSQVSVERPNGQVETIDNPMYRYRFPLNSDDTIDGITNATDRQGRVYAPFNEAPYTVRHPARFDPEQSIKVQATWVKGISDNDAVEDMVNTNQQVQDMSKLFTMRSYPPFSNAGWSRQSGKAEDYQSLESVHNNLHNCIGGMTHGHMASLDAAAFDPAFWMHHGNVERLLSIFQALNPADYKDWPDDKWLSGTVEPWFTGRAQLDGRGTWTKPPGQNEGTDSPLTPFHKDTNGTVYDSDGCRYISQFGYAFEELQYWLPKYHTSGRFDEPLYCKDIRKSLNEKYGWALPTLQSVRRIAHGDPWQDLPAADPRTLPLSERQYKEYVVDVLVDRFANEGQTFVIDLFLGEVPADVRSWETADKLGVVTIFGGSRFMNGTCANCASQAEEQETRLVTGQVSITNALIDFIVSKNDLDGDQLKSLEKDEVGAFLKKHLNWRVAKIGETEFDLHDIPSLKVSVAVATATLPVGEDEFVDYGEFDIIDTPTRGRPCGYSVGDTI